MKHFIVIILLCLSGMQASAQEKTSFSIYDRKTGKPLEFAIISSTHDWLGTTDSLGRAHIIAPSGSQDIVITMAGYDKLDTTLTFPLPGGVTIYLLPAEATLDEVTIVASTRNNQAIENSPMKVEVLGAAELGEEAGIKPGNIASILGDVSGVQIQQSSATSGNSNVRIQGLGGRYTQILRDGMPLYDGFSGGFGILTVPPLDLKQIELIKGSASTLYGGGAIAGLINLISRRPTRQQQLDALVNYGSLNEGNANVFTARRNEKLGYTLFASYTRQGAMDVNKDGFSDLPDANSIIVHPRVYYYPDEKTTIYAGYSGAFDDRTGGDMKAIHDKSDPAHPYYERNTTSRHTGEYLLEHKTHKAALLTLKGNISSFARDTRSNTTTVNGQQTSYYNEASVLLPLRHADIVAGANIVGDNYRTLSPDTAQLQQFSNFTIGAFAQLNVRIKERTTLEAGLRTDHHNRYGWFALPRIAAFHRFSAHWASRAGFGMGYKTPNPLVQQNTEYSVLSLLPVPSSLRAERSYGYNAEVNYKTPLGEDASLFINQAFFLTQVQNPILFVPQSTGQVQLTNAGAPIISQGWDSYVRAEIKGWELYLGYTYTDARNTYVTGSNFVPLTPRHRAATVVVWEPDAHWRVGLEGSYTGPQYRYDGTSTPGYVFAAAMIQRNIGTHVILVLNGENLFDYRMSNVEALYTGTIAAPVFKPLWAPIDGRVINCSVRWKL